VKWDEESTAVLPALHFLSIQGRRLVPRPPRTSEQLSTKTSCLVRDHCGIRIAAVSFTALLPVLTMIEAAVARTGLRQAIATTHHAPKRRAFHQCKALLATPTESQPGVRAAPAIRFTRDKNQFTGNRSQAQVVSRGGPSRGRGARDGATGAGAGFGGRDSQQDELLNRVRIVPASPSYFTATPKYTDDLLHLSSLLRRHLALPVLPPGEAPRVAWKTISQYKVDVGEPVRSKGYNMLLAVLKRLNYIHPSLIPAEVTQALEKFKRLVQPYLNRPKPIVVDQSGRARAVGRRKASHAAVFVVEGEGECLINGKSLTEYFGRLHDRESAVWALKATQRLDKYNVWALVKGGGTTGQAEAITLGVAKALMAHEPDLRPALRRGTSYLHWKEMFHPLTSSQPDVSLAILVVWRGRSLVNSRPARCPRGSSGSLSRTYYVQNTCSITRTHRQAPGSKSQPTSCQFFNQSHGFHDGRGDKNSSATRGIIPAQRCSETSRHRSPVSG
jgi:small subunit ribosomal protein S9